MGDQLVSTLLDVKRDLIIDIRREAVAIVDSDPEDPADPRGIIGLFYPRHRGLSERRIPSPTSE